MFKRYYEDDVFLNISDSINNKIKPLDSRPFSSPLDLMPSLHFSNEANPEGPKVLVYRDSYFVGMMNFFNYNFSESVYIWSPFFQYKMVEKLKPEIVIFV